MALLKLVWWNLIFAILLLNSVFLGIIPVPIDHTGSYAIIRFSSFLIPFNPWPGSKYQTSEPATVEIF